MCVGGESALEGKPLRMICLVLYAAGGDFCKCQLAEPHGPARSSAGTGDVMGSIPQFSDLLLAKHIRGHMSVPPTCPTHLQVSLSLSKQNWGYQAPVGPHEN